MASCKEQTNNIPDHVRWRILIVLLAAIFMSLVGVSIVNVALPSIQHSLNASQSDIQWVLSGYALTFGVILVSAGRAGDLMGRGGIFLIGVAVFTLSSVVAGLAPDANSLNIARFMQGIGSGLLNPQAIGMIQQYFRGSERGRAFGYFGTMVGFSVAIGPVFGGLLIKFGGADLGWRLTFLINVPIGLLTFILGYLWFPRPLISKPHIQASTNQSANGHKTHVKSGLSSLDPVGSVLLGIGVLALLLPFVESGRSNFIWLLIPASFVLFYVWIKWEKHYKRMGFSPMAELEIFSIPSFSNGILIMSLYFLGMTSIWVLVALYFQDHAGKTAFETSLVGIPSAFISAYAANWAGKRVMQYGRKIVVIGLIMAIIGLALSIVFIFMHEQYGTSVWWLVISLGILGVGQGSVISPNQALTLEEVPISYAGSSGAIMQTGQRIGTSVGIAMITAIVFACLSRSDWSMAISVGFTIIILVMLFALAIAIKDSKQRSKT